MLIQKTMTAEIANTLGRTRSRGRPPSNAGEHGCVTSCHVGQSAAIMMRGHARPVWPGPEADWRSVAERQQLTISEGYPTSARHVHRINFGNPQLRCRSRNSRILRVASVAASSLYSAQRPNMVLPGWSSG